VLCHPSRLRFLAARLLLCGLPWFLAIAPSPASAFRFYTVGSDAACSFSDIQQAIDSATDPDGNTVAIAQDASFTSQHLVITGQTINLLGGLATCDAASYIGQSTLVGTTGHSVIEIEGASEVYIGGLEITGADMDDSHSGGGIYFGGQGSLTLNTTWVHNNQAGYGGGIDMSPSGPSTLNLQQGTTISGNVALVSGGGVRVEGQTELTSTSGPDQSVIYIALNAALGQGGTGYGGGFEIVGPAVANISSFVDLNTAEYGGGIAAVTNDNGDAIVNLYVTNPDVPPTIFGNQASQTGGGVYLLPFKSTFDENTASLCADNFVIDGNIAQEGAAI
jgi:hypothetical protein